ncbi:uncharacterized protein TRUGW13939_09578 [Talaromyces rugulosus]|uniref:Myb-like DNA-binding domain-containing protein n=1 Tax=Talaromyces rugulosus TaxID=121627 RepID=A0A7H8R8J4_TALRU|nr:uncharacterized protein TRUGW13939_09578 [Talaromyces rugulosus]QKX62417.1 hypothetical protein TRUGW13939_09578 [Talaromyces rugulosus]
MAARITENDQIQFLLSCVRHSNYGQVDFDPVVEECQIISKGAAAKRLSRLLKRYPAGAKSSTTSSNTTNSKTPKPATGESNDEEEEKDTAVGQKSGRSGKGNGGGGGSPAKKSSAGPVVGGIVKKTASTATKGRKGKAAAVSAAPVSATETPGFGEDGLLDGINVKTEEDYDDGMYNASLDPAGLFGSDA